MLVMETGVDCPVGWHVSNGEGVMGRRKRRNRHHMIPRSRHGSDSPWNLLLIHEDNHVWWHKVFGNRTFDEVIRLLIRVRRAKGGQSWRRNLSDVALSANAEDLSSN